MRLGMIGLGKMGGNMALRLIRAGHEVVGFDIDPAVTAQAAAGGAIGAASIAELVGHLAPPRLVWIMVPAGPVTRTTIAEVASALAPGDVIVDGGNSRYTDTVAQAALLAERGVHLLDAGTSGGIWGLEEGYCLMVGGAEEAFEIAEPVLAALAPPNGYAHVGPTGAGHFTKMVHNGIEYALMQGYAEGLDILRASPFGIEVDQVTELWRHGSVVRSWLLDLLANALRDDPDLAGVDDYVEDSGEGRWTVETAIESGIPAPAIALALFARFDSRRERSYADQVLAALRREFGGHAVRSGEPGAVPPPPADL